MARNPRAFAAVKHEIVSVQADTPVKLPPSIPYRALESSPDAVKQLLDHLHTRGWAVLKLPDEMRSRVKAARENGNQAA